MISLNPRCRKRIIVVSGCDDCPYNTYESETSFRYGYDACKIKKSNGVGFARCNGDKDHVDWTCPLEEEAEHVLKRYEEVIDETYTVTTC